MQRYGGNSEADGTVSGSNAHGLWNNLCAVIRGFAWAFVGSIRDNISISAIIDCAGSPLAKAFVVKSERVLKRNGSAS